MPNLDIAGKRIAIDLVVFDKDGTLVDFDRLWAGKLKRAAACLSEGLALPPASQNRLLTVLGVDVTTGQVVPESPLAVSSLPKLSMVATVILYELGFAWHAAESAVGDWFTPIIETIPAPEDLLPIGDVRGLLETLHQANAHIAVLTSDDRSATIASLPMLGIDHLVAHAVCGDDPVPNKPAPDGLLRLSALFDIPPARILMVGDSVADMRCGRNAGAACCLGVLSGTGREQDIAAHAHVVAPDIHAIKVAG